MDAESLLVGRYRMRRKIGAGGIGQVWTAHDTVLGRDVAVKVQEIDPEGDRAPFERFVREARSAAALQHPNVVTIFDSGTEHDTAFLVMELLPGPTLTGHLAEHGPLPETEAVALAAQVASGLAAAHAAGIVHRDIKPANLMFDGRGTLKIVDFGIARLTQSVTTQLTLRNAIIGSPPYLSPEGINGRPVDERSDVYSLGAVLMVMLTGRGPFDGPHPLALMQQHLHAQPPRISDRRPGIDPALDALVAEMLSKAPEDRPQSALAVLDRLTGTAYAGSSPVAAAVSAGATPPTAPPASVERPGPAGPRRRRSSIGAGVLAGVGALALAAVVVLVTTSRPDTPTATQPAASQVAILPTAAVASGSDPSPPAASPPAASPPAASPPAASPPTARPTAGPTPAAATPRSAPPARTSPTTTRSKRPEPSATASASAVRRPPPPARTVGPRTADSETTTGPDLPQALATLRGAVRDASSGGGIEAKTADDLTRRVDGLSRHLEKRGPEATKKVDDLGRHLTGLTEKGDLTPDAEQRIGAALSGVRAAVAGG